MTNDDPVIWLPADPLLSLPTSAIDPVNDADRALIQAWLEEYARKRNTLRAYAREARRFWLWWSTVRHGRTLKSFDRADLSAFQAVLASPPAEWIAQPDSSAWRPFKGPLKPEVRRQALLILQGMFEYLVQAKHLPANPVRLVRDKGPAPRRASRRVPTEATLASIATWLSQRADLVAETADLSARDAFVWQWIYWTGARRHELVRATLGNVVSLANAGRSRWWWEVIGKGEVEASIPLTSEAVSALARFLGCGVEDLSATIRKDPDRPLVPATRGARRGIQVTQIYDSVRRVADAASNHAVDVGIAQEEAIKIGATRPHALRAFRATHLFNAGVDARYVQRFMRHVDINTTLIYDHTDADRFHDAIK